MDHHTLTKACCVYTCKADAKFVLLFLLSGIYITIKINADQIIFYKLIHDSLSINADCRTNTYHQFYIMQRMHAVEQL